jgi:hypothetical protein
MRAHGREGRQKSMRAGKFLAMLAIAALAIGAFGAAALAAKKRDTNVIFKTGSPRFSCCSVFGTPTGSKPRPQVSAKGTLHTVTACKSQRVVKLQVLDANGDVLAPAPKHNDDVTHSDGGWSIWPRDLPAGANSVRVKAKKRTPGKFVCKAGVSISVPIPVPIPDQPAKPPGGFG